jgi:hypothetical protein
MTILFENGLARSLKNFWATSVVHKIAALNFHFSFPYFSFTMDNLNHYGSSDEDDSHHASVIPSSKSLMVVNTAPDTGFDVSGKEYQRSNACRI